MYKRIILSLFFLLTVLCIKSIYNYSNDVFSEISDEVLRLHVIANSNDEKDQEIKLKVRDKILEYMKLNCSEFESKEEAILFVKNNLYNIKNEVEKILNDNGFEYSSKIEVGKSYFPTKHYSDISLPQGKYDAIRIYLGEAQGENWWCVMFPPLCFIDSNAILEDKKILKDNLSTEGYELISENTNEVKIKFKIIEIIEGLKKNSY